MKNSIRHSISTFLLTLFLFSNVAGLHAFSHCEDLHDNGEDNTPVSCLVCDLALTQQLTPVFQEVETDFDLNNSPLVDLKKDIIKGDVIYKSSRLQNFHFGRPPPVLG